MRSLANFSLVTLYGVTVITKLLTFHLCFGCSLLGDALFVSTVCYSSASHDLDLGLRAGFVIKTTSTWILTHFLSLVHYNEMLIQDNHSQ